MWLLVGSIGGKSLGRYIHVSEPFFSGENERFQGEKERRQSTEERSVSLITTFQGFKKALNVLGINSEQRMSQNCAHHFARECILPNMSYRWWHDWTGHHNGSPHYPGRFLRPLWYIKWDKKEKEKVLSHLIEIAKVYRALIHVRQVIKTLIMVTRLFAERNLQIP